MADGVIPGDAVLGRGIVGDELSAAVMFDRGTAVGFVDMRETEICVAVVTFVVPVALTETDGTEAVELGAVVDPTDDNGSEELGAWRA